LMTLMACGGPSLETRVEELRVMVIQTETAEFFPNQSIDVNLLIPNPKGKEATALYWTCTNLGNGCIEKEYYQETGQNWGGILSIAENPIGTVTLDIPPPLTAIVSELPNSEVFGATLLWVLACENDLCPIIEDWENGDPDFESMSDPFSLLKDLPIQGTSLAYRPLLMSQRDESERVKHPTLTYTGEDNISISKPSDNFILPFGYNLNRLTNNQDSLYFSYATQGGFSTNERIRTLISEEDGSFESEWFGSEDMIKGESLLMVILENGEGGLSFWTSTANIE
jgi:hypothetical protein